MFHRKILLAAACVLVVGTISTTLGLGYHFRSESYRQRVVSQLERRLGLDVRVASIEPLSLRARRLTDVQVFLPKRAKEVFSCRRIDWLVRKEDAKPHHELILRDGWLLAGAREWGRDEYDLLLHSGLGHDFARMGIDRIDLENIDLRWSHPSFTLSAGRCRGQLRFDDQGHGRVSLTADTLNSVAMSQPVNITASFTPGSGLRFHRVSLTVPEIPISGLGMDRFWGGPVEFGSFEGTLSYEESPGRPGRVSAGGRVRDARLSELTRSLAGGPLEAVVYADVNRIVFVGDHLEELDFRGRITGLDVAPVARRLGVADLNGRIDLHVYEAAYRNGALERFSAIGHARGVSLDVLSRLVGRGRMTGTLSVDIDSATIHDNRLTGASVTLKAVPPPDRPGVIDRDLLREASRQMLGLDATAILPESVSHIEYVDLGLRLIVNDGLLRIQGTHGPKGRTILTVRLFGREYGVLKEPGRTYVVGDLLETLRARLEQYDPEDLRSLLRRQTQESPDP